MHSRIGWSLLAIVVATYAWCSNVAGADAVLPDPDGKPADMTKPVKVFILMGQSNMLGFGKVAGGEGSLEHATKTKGLYPYLIDDAGNWTVRKDVRNVRVMCSGSGAWKTYLNDWLTPIGGNIGPEIGIGHHVGEVLDAPVLILKSCIGNRALGWDLLPPGADGYAGNPERPRKPRKDVEGWYAGIQYDGDVAAAQEVLQNLGTYYPGATKYEIAGFCFWQGAKDGGKDEWANAYEKNLVQLIKALREDFDAPNAPFVCATLGQSAKGSGGAYGKILEAQLAVDGTTGKYPEFKGNVATFYAHPVSKGGSANGHYNGHAETYMNVGEGMGKAMADLLTAGSPARPKGTTASVEPTGRKPRSVAPAKMDALNGTVIKTLAKLSRSGELARAGKVPLSKARGPATLISVTEDSMLTFRSNSGDVATIAARELILVDFLNLSVLISQMKPDSTDAVAVVGVYLECMGRTGLADEKFAKAGAESTAKMSTFFE